VFSMDGEVAPLQEIVELGARHCVRVVVDEAHGTGTLGPGGRGALAAAGIEDQVDVIVGTLGKALGSYGAFAACDEAMSRYLVNVARTFIYSTALPPPAVAGALAALELIEERPRRVDKLAANAALLRAELAREGFDTRGSRTQIVPLVVGDAETAMEMCGRALAGGVFAQAIRPPTVPPMTSRLRLAVMASHSFEELRAAARTLGRAAREVGFEPSTGSPGALRAAEDDGLQERERIAVEGVAPEPADDAGVFDFELGRPAIAAAGYGETARPFDHEAPAQPDGAGAALPSEAGRRADRRVAARAA
jgi:Aminotransferase class I and II